MVQNASRLACARQCQIARGAHDAIHRSHGRRPTTRKGDRTEPVIVRNEDVISLTGVSEREFNATCDQQLAEIERRRKLYLGNRPHPQIAGLTVIVVDDGIATGATTLSL